MKLSIYEKPTPPIKEKEVTLQLRRVGHDILLCAVDKNGIPMNQGNLLSINSDGRIELIPHVNANLGFQLDEQSCIKLKNHV